MLTAESTNPAPTCQEPFRHSPLFAAQQVFEFANGPHRSEREFAASIGVPPSTFHFWHDRFRAEPGNAEAAFFLSPSGYRFLQRVSLSAIVHFNIRGASGCRPLAAFLEDAGLARFVSTTPSALLRLIRAVEADIGTFADIVQPALAAELAPCAISIIVDENFHHCKPCLVAMEAASGFILVECFRPDRTAATWAEVIDGATGGLPVEVLQVTSDMAKALLSCAEQELAAAHCPDLFHLVRDLLKPLLPPLNQPIQRAGKALRKAEAVCARLAGQARKGLSAGQAATLSDAARARAALGEELRQATRTRDEALDSVRGIGDDFHPFDRGAGQPVTPEEVGQCLGQRLDAIKETMAGVGMTTRAEEALDKARGWLATLTGVVAWFWMLVNDEIGELGLTEEQEAAFKGQLLAGHYWAMAAGKARTAEERQRLAGLAAKLLEAGRAQGGPLGQLAGPFRGELDDTARALAGLFQRSSSSVEGRNGRLSLYQHGHTRLTPGRLRALTVIHNYMTRRADGTTAAERFFGKPHQRLFSWLLERMPDIPRPAAKRSKRAA